MLRTSESAEPNAVMPYTDLEKQQRERVRTHGGGNYVLALVQPTAVQPNLVITAKILGLLDLSRA